MSKLSKITLSLFIFLIVGLSTYGYTVVRDRNSVMPIEIGYEEIYQENDNDSPSDENQDLSDDEKAADEELTDEEIDAMDENAEEVENPDIIVEKNNFLNILPEDCNNECGNFKKSEDFKYCQQSCGLTPINKEDPKKEGCKALTGLDADYCFKDEAITKHEMVICDQIKDLGIQKICRNRIAAYIMDLQNR